MLENEAIPALQTLEDGIGTAYEMADEKYPEVLEMAKEQAILKAWQTLAGGNEELSLEEAKAEAKNEIARQLDNPTTDEYKALVEEAKAAIKEEIGNQLENPTTPEYEELRDEAIALAKEKIEEEVRKEAEPLVEEKKAELDRLGATALEKAEQLEDLLDGKTTGVTLDKLASQVERISKKTWHFIGKTLVKAGISAEEYEELDEAVYEASGLIEERPNVEIKDQLLAYETVLNGLVSQQVVTVEVKAEVVSKNSVDSEELIPLEVFSANFSMDVDSSAESILAQIAENGIENKALSQWDSFYNDYLSGVRKDANLFTLTTNLNVHELPRTLRNVQNFDYKEGISHICEYVRNAIPKQAEPQLSPESSVQKEKRINPRTGRGNSHKRFL